MAGEKIPVPVLYDGNDNFLAGELFAVDIRAQVIGEVQKPSGPSVPPFNDSAATTTTYVKDPVFGALFLNMTELEWQALIRETLNTGGGSGGGTEISRDYTINTPTNVITDAGFAGASIKEVFYNGVNVPRTTLTIAGNTITFPYTMEDGNVNVLFSPAV